MYSKPTSAQLTHKDARTGWTCCLDTVKCNVLLTVHAGRLLRLHGETERREATVAPDPRGAGQLGSRQEADGEDDDGVRAGAIGHREFQLHRR